MACTICLEHVYDNNTATATLICGHSFHLCCIGNEFNAIGVMRCPDCGITEESDWSFPCLGNGEDFVADQIDFDVVQRPPYHTFALHHHGAGNHQAAARRSGVLARPLVYAIPQYGATGGLTYGFSGQYVHPHQIHANRLRATLLAAYQVGCIVRPVMTCANYQPMANPNPNSYGSAATAASESANQTCRNVRPRTCSNYQPARNAPNSHGLAATATATAAADAGSNAASATANQAGHNVRARPSANYQQPAAANPPNTCGLAATATAAADANALSAAGGSNARVALMQPFPHGYSLVASVAGDVDLIDNIYNNME